MSALQPRRVAVPASAATAPPQPVPARPCACCGHQGPLSLPATNVGHWPMRNASGVVIELQCKIPGCSCRMSPVAAEWWRP